MCVQQINKGRGPAIGITTQVVRPQASALGHSPACKAVPLHNGPVIQARPAALPSLRSTLPQKGFEDESAVRHSLTYGVNSRFYR